ncbi:hypothetical protein MYX82_08395, partial [Acidobacteria bacterium AH-259-D05]|nr:hypothetical protein [Acidobacteria bacterium AH-259-D05]
GSRWLVRSIAEELNNSGDKIDPGRGVILFPVTEGHFIHSDFLSGLPLSRARIQSLLPDVLA